MIKVKQLDFFNEIMETDFREINFIKDTVSLIKYFKYLRAELESKQSYLPEGGIEFKYLNAGGVYISHVLYYLATISYISSRRNSEYKSKDADYFYDKTSDNAFLSTYNTRSLVDLYKLSSRIKSSLERFKMIHSKALNSDVKVKRLISEVDRVTEDLNFTLKASTQYER